MAFKYRLPQLINLTMLIGISLLPIYTSRSGGVQYSHMVLMIGAITVVFSSSLRFSVVEKILLALMGFAFARESVAVIDGASVNVLMNPLYLAFNAFLFVALARWYRSPNAIGVLAVGVMIATAIAFLGIFLVGAGPDLRGYERAIGTFNNPNQLGYFAVCTFSLSIYLYLNKVLGSISFMLLILACVAMAIVSLSKAAILSIAIPLVVLGFVFLKRHRSYALGALMTALLAASAIFAISSGMLDEYTFAQRIYALGSDPDDSLRGRGYKVILEANGLELLLGLGAEETSRIFGEGRKVEKMHEVHSTIFSFFVTYGVVGGMLFMTLICLWIRRVSISAGWIGLFAVAGPPLAYGLTHNGSRFSLFWLLVALCFVPVRYFQGRSRQDAAGQEFVYGGHVSGG